MSTDSLPTDPVDAEVTRVTIFAAQVCVPKAWTDEQARGFLEKEAPCGTSNGWQMRHTGDADLSGCDERVQCTQHPHRCHIMFNA